LQAQDTTRQFPTSLKQQKKQYPNTNHHSVPVQHRIINLRHGSSKNKKNNKEYGEKNVYHLAEIVVT